MIQNAIGGITVVPLRGFVLFPGMITPIFLHQDAVVRALESAIADPEPVLFLTQRNSDLEHPTEQDMYGVGVVCHVRRLMRFPAGELRVLAEGLHRARVLSLSQQGGRLLAEIEPLPQTVSDTVKAEALAEHLRVAFQSLLETSARTPPELDLVLREMQDPARLADYVSGNIVMGQDISQGILESCDVVERLEKVLNAVEHERNLAELNASIHNRVQTAMDNNQREYYLKEQMRVIRNELGDLDPGAADQRLFRDRLEELELPEVVGKEAQRELDRMIRMHPESAEYGVARSYLEWMTTMPWNKETEDVKDLNSVQQVLDEDHHGLEAAKDRIVEYLAVRQLNPKQRGPVLCFLGPPGVGKTSLGRSIARALGRKFGRVSLGGVRDESEIRGHRRTYIGALPGRIIQEVHRAGTRNPVLLLDEIDKLGADFRGDPGSALLEVLDSEQNSAFMDHYLDVPFDLSQVMFLCTANIMEPVASALRDRMEPIELPGYTLEEKIAIAQKHLLPRQIGEHGLKSSRTRVSRPALRTMTEHYTNEAGVRQLERSIATLCRKMARKVVQKEESSFRIGIKELEPFLGRPKHQPDVAERSNRAGVAVGLAWTEVGGVILFVEATAMEGSRQFRITGQLGDVMRESAETALSYVRARAKELGIDPGFFGHADIHLHVPAGAVPKDGPSAGVTAAVALASLLTGRVVRPRLAMTGEITLRGKVLPVGGVKEKVLAARRAGIKTIILPEANVGDLEDVPDEVRKDLTFHSVESVDQVLELALSPARSLSHRPLGKKPSGETSRPPVPSTQRGNRRPSPGVGR